MHAGKSSPRAHASGKKGKGGGHTRLLGPWLANLPRPLIFCSGWKKVWEGPAKGKVGGRVWDERNESYITEYWNDLFSLLAFFLFPEGRGGLSFTTARKKKADRTGQLACDENQIST